MKKKKSVFSCQNIKNRKELDRIMYRPYKCEVDVQFPTAIDAKRACEVLSVDDEIGNRVTKQFSICSATSDSSDVEIEKGTILRV